MLICNRRSRSLEELIRKVNAVLWSESHLQATIDFTVTLVQSNIAKCHDARLHPNVMLHSALHAGRAAVHGKMAHCNGLIRFRMVYLPSTPSLVGVLLLGRLGA